MHPAFDAFEYAGFLLKRWRFVAVVCIAAVAAAAAVSLMLPKRYTSTASILIDAPAGNDPRAATAVSPIYLESLKTYERFADSDTLFRRAIKQFGLADVEGTAAADTLKKRVLKVTKPRDTKLLEIQVTLRDPNKAQSVAQFIAEETATTSRSFARQTEDEFIAEARKTLDTSTARLEAVESAINAEATQAQPELLETEIEGAVELRNRVRRQLISADADLAGRTPDPDLRARRESLQKQSDALNDEIQKKQSLLGRRRASQDRLEAERRNARTAQETARTRLNDSLASAGSRGERLRIVDPGVVPERPSSPHLFLNICGALLLALAAAILYLTLEFALRNRRHAREFEARFRSAR